MEANTTILLGRIYTVNPDSDWAEAVLINGNKIQKVGKRDDILSLASAETEIIDMGEKLILPGFIDCHVHFMLGGATLNSIDFSEAISKQDFQRMIEEFHQHNQSEWVTGGNWDHLRFEGAELPTKEWVDHITPENPLFVSRLDLHMVLVNSKALEMAGITKSTADPSGGLIMRDSVTGEPTGILVDSAMRLVQDLMPARSDDLLKSDLDAALEAARRKGVTSIHDISTKDSVRAYREYERKNKLTCRINSVLSLEEMEYLEELKGEHSGNSDFLRFGGLKAFADGSLGSHTAWFHEPYSDLPESNGLPMELMANKKLGHHAIEADNKGNQLLIHAIGDKAVTELINICEDVLKSNGKRDRRFRIEHVQHLRQSDVERIAQLNIIASMQPSHLFEDCCWCEDLIGEERCSGTYAIKTLIGNGVKVCFGSDWTVADLNPIHGIYCAVTRRTRDGKNPDGWYPDEKINVKEAVEAYTINAAYASYEENIKGSIEEGKLADLIVLDKNIFEINEENIISTDVIMTIVDGKVVYDSEEE